MKARVKSDIEGKSVSRRGEKRDSFMKMKKGFVKCLQRERGKSLVSEVKCIRFLKSERRFSKKIGNNEKWNGGVFILNG